MVTSILRRTTTVTRPDDWAARTAALEPRLRAVLDRQPGFVSHELRRDGDGGRMVEETSFRTADDCRAYLRNGAAAMCATLLDAALPTAAFPHGTWHRETVERA